MNRPRSKSKRIISRHRCSYELRRGYPRLVILFGSGMFMPGEFELHEALKELAFDFIVIGDPNHVYGLSGIPGIGHDLPAVHAWLARRAQRYDRVFTFGTSHGGTMAMMAAEALGADASLACSPISGFRRADISTLIRGAEQYERLQQFEERLLASDPETLDRFGDFVGYLTARSDSPTRHVAIITTREFSDRVHGWRFAQIDGITVRELPDAPHPGIIKLIRRGQFGDLMSLIALSAAPVDDIEAYCRRFFGPYPPEPAVSTAERP